jgi:hypothetical protein
VRLFGQHGWMGIMPPGMYPSDVTEEELAFVLLCREDSPQRKHDLSKVFQRRFASMALKANVTFWSREVLVLATNATPAHLHQDFEPAH